MSRPAGLLHRNDLVKDLGPVTGQESPAVDDHIDFVGPGLNGVSNVQQFDRERGPSRGKGCRDGGNVDATARELFTGHANEVGVNAHRSHRGR